MMAKIRETHINIPADNNVERNSRMSDLKSCTARLGFNRLILILLALLLYVTFLSLIVPMSIMNRVPGDDARIQKTHTTFERLADYLYLLNGTDIHAHDGKMKLPPVDTQPHIAPAEDGKAFPDIQPIPVVQPIPELIIPAPQQQPTQGNIIPGNTKPLPASFIRGGPGSDESKAASVKNAMHFAWDSYDKKCFGQDELQPLTGTCGNWLNMGLTVIDAMDTMYVMGGFDKELEKGTNWIDKHLYLDNNRDVSFFETVIRMVGGLMSIFDMTQNPMFLQRAKHVGDKLLPAFNTPTGLPMSTVNMKTGTAKLVSWTRNSALLAEVGTVQLEYFALSHYLEDNTYYKKAQKVVDHLDRMKKPFSGLYPMYLATDTSRFNNALISLGAMGDSFYEYLLKMWLITGKKNDQYLRMYRESMKGVAEELFFTVEGRNDMGYVADKDGNTLRHKMDHLACFVPGMMALGVHSGASDSPERDMDMAKKIMTTCYENYKVQNSGIGAESMMFGNTGMRNGNKMYHLRPETVESLFVMYRVTHDEKYRTWGWEIFQKIEEHCRVSGGYTGLKDISNPNSKQNKMESFFLAETLKYLYLLYENDSVLDINEWVFNTECHPLRVFKTDAGLT